MSSIGTTTGGDDMTKSGNAGENAVADPGKVAEAEGKR